MLGSLNPSVPIVRVVLDVDARGAAWVERVAGGARPGHARPADTGGARPVRPSRPANSVGRSAVCCSYQPGDHPVDEMLM